MAGRARPGEGEEGHGVEACPSASTPLGRLEHIMSIETDEFRGFDEARRILWAHESRSRVHERLASTGLMEDREIAAVHVDNASQADRIHLVAYDLSGQRLRETTLYVMDLSQRLDVTPEFDHDYTGMTVPAGSELEHAIVREDGWVIDMDVLRRYDPLADRRATQRAVLLEHLADMMNSGQARGFLLGQLGDPGTA